jgi:methyl-accepting chemotaxis protein
VRDLAQRSATAAKEVKALVTGAVKQVGRRGTARQAGGSAMEEIGAGIVEAAAIIRQMPR